MVQYAFRNVKSKIAIIFILPQRRRKDPGNFYCSRGPVQNRRLLGDVRDKSDMARALDGDGELTLMLSADAGHAAGQDLRALADKAAETRDILVIYMLYLL